MPGREREKMAYDIMRISITYKYIPLHVKENHAEAKNELGLGYIEDN